MYFEVISPLPACYSILFIVNPLPLCRKAGPSVPCAGSTAVVRCRGPCFARMVWDETSVEKNPQGLQRCVRVGIYVQDPIYMYVRTCKITRGEGNMLVCENQGQSIAAKRKMHARCYRTCTDIQAVTHPQSYAIQ
jgi:hypothetical protein